MTTIRSFFSGFVLGFGSGVAFRALAEKDFEPVKEAAKTTVSGLQKIGDSLTDTFGRMREAVDDLRAEVRAERKSEPVKVRPKVTVVKAVREKSRKPGTRRKTGAEARA